MAEIPNLRERLAAGQQAFQESSAEGGYSNELPPDGTYQAIVKAFDFFEAKMSGDLFFKTIVTIAFDREYQGREVETIHNATDHEKLAWLKTHLARLGADVDNVPLADLISPGSQHLEALLDVPVEIAIKTSDNTDSQGVHYRNVYVNKRLGDALAAGGPGVTGGPRVGGRIEQPDAQQAAAPEVPADTSGFAQAPVGPGGTADDDIPF